MALWRKTSRKRKPVPTSENTSTSAPQRQRKIFSPEVKLLAVKALEAGLTPAEVSEIVGAGNFSVTTWARAFRDGGMEALVRKSTRSRRNVASMQNCTISATRRCHTC